MVLPADAVVLFVQADRVGDDPGLTVAADDGGVKVVDDAETVAAELKGVGEGPRTVLAPVEEVLAVLSGGRVEVRHVHLVDGGTLDHRPTIIGKIVQHQALAVGEADPQRPALPLDLLARYGEARALGLDDVEGAQAWPLSDGAGAEVAGLRRQGDD